MGVKKYHHGDLRRALLDAALVLLREQGSQALTLRELARRAGVSHTAPYRHFEDRDALLAAIAAEGFEQLRKKLEGVSARTPQRRFEVGGRTYVRFALEHPEHYRVMFGPELGGKIEAHPELATAASKAYLVLVDKVRACQEAGVIRKGSPERFAMVAWSTVHGLAGLLIDGLLPAEGRELEMLISTSVSTVFRGLNTQD